jgi:hypothetical protein
MVTAPAPMANQEHTAAIKAFRVGGDEEQVVCTNNCLVNWDTSGKFVFFGFKTENSYALPLTQPFGLPKLPPAGSFASGGFSSREDRHNHSEFCGVGHQSLVLRVHPPKYATQSV